MPIILKKIHSIHDESNYAFFSIINIGDSCIYNKAVNQSYKIGLT